MSGIQSPSRSKNEFEWGIEIMSSQFGSKHEESSEEWITKSLKSVISNFEESNEFPRATFMFP